MNKTIMYSILFTLCFCLVSTNADILPPKFPGISLSPLDTNDVRMQSELIDIYYGDTCRIEASYNVQNQTQKNLDKKIGFPFNPWALRPRNQDTTATVNKIYNFSLNLNGTKLLATDVPFDQKIQADNFSWFGWTCKLKPGANTIQLSYLTLNSWGNSGYRWERTMEYNLNSDKNWPGKINVVRVTIHFPKPIFSRQILAKTFPSGYRINGQDISWQFTSISPKPENNIILDIIDVTVFSDILKYEKVLSTSKTDNLTKLKAAKFFAGLVPYDGIHMTAPDYFTRSYYENTVLINLNSAEREIFDSTYEFNNGSGPHEGYALKHRKTYNDHDTIHQSIVSVMNRIGYFEKIQYPLIYRYIIGAKKLFNDLVASEPNNAHFWKAYIENYFSIETGACYPCNVKNRSTNFPQSQQDLVRNAYQQCGSDKEIALWNNFVFPKNYPIPDTVEMENYENQSQQTSIIINDFDYSSEKALSPEEFSLVKQAYSVHRNSLLIRNAAHFDESMQKKLYVILGGYQFKRNKFCRDLAKLQKQE